MIISEKMHTLISLFVLVESIVENCGSRMILTQLPLPCFCTPCMIASFSKDEKNLLCLYVVDVVFSNGCCNCVKWPFPIALTEVVEEEGDNVVDPICVLKL